MVLSHFFAHTRAEEVLQIDDRRREVEDLEVKEPQVFGDIGVSEQNVVDP